MNEERLMELVGWLEAGAPERSGVAGFWMAGFGIDVANVYRQAKFDSTLATDHLPKCGTVCCVAGTTNVWWGNKANISDTCTAQAVLGLTARQAERLFYPPEMFIQNITPDWAARCIRHLIKTGKVNWRDTRKAKPEEPKELTVGTELTRIFDTVREKVA